MSARGIPLLPIAMKRDAFMPARVDTCSQSQRALPLDYDPELHSPHGGTSGPRNANRTLVPHRWSPPSEVLLDSGVLTPGERGMYKAGSPYGHPGINPITRIGITSRVRARDNPYPARAKGNFADDPCSSAPSIFERQSGEPGQLIRMYDDSTDNDPMYGGRRYYYQPAYWDRRSGPLGGPYEPVGQCPVDPTDECPRQFPPLDIDTDHLYSQNLAVAVGSDGEYLSDSWWQGGPHTGWSAACGATQTVVNHPHAIYATRAADMENFRAPSQEPFRRPEPFRPPAQEHLRRPEHLRERLRSRRVPEEPMTGMMHGLGSTWVDPRFQPGPPRMFRGDDSHWAHGGHAGGPTFGAFNATKFMPGGSWNSKYVHGFGDGEVTEGRRYWVDAS